MQPDSPDLNPHDYNVWGIAERDRPTSCATEFVEGHYDEYDISLNKDHLIFSKLKVVLLNKYIISLGCVQ